MKIKSIIEPKIDLFQPVNYAEEEHYLIQILNQIHSDGPIDAAIFEKLALLKKFRPELFAKYEAKLMSFMGLFYKTEEPKSLIEEVYSIYASCIREEFGADYTPVQADVYKRILSKKYFSFSAPTSVGKSYLFRDLIKNSEKDVVIVVPTRSLIAEYISALTKIVNKATLVMEFIEIVNTKHTKRRIYVITPERGAELFKNLNKLDIEYFLFDEAQISEEEIRGMRFDSFVRRVDRLIPNAKKVFTHPFIDNPEAQLRKHNFQTDADHKRYEQNSVGKIFLSATPAKKFSYFSPYTKEKEIETNENVVKNCLSSGGTILIYVSKRSIYDNKFKENFSEYIELCPQINTPKALEYIEKLKEFIGASDSEEKSSTMIDMMKRGIVFHHGSIPLKGRLLIEDFINKGFAKICFATSTLAQGINMPFSIVWINYYSFRDKSEEQKILSLKNLIGRSGRVSENKNSFDYGYIIIEKKNVKNFCLRIFGQVRLSEESVLDDKESNVSEDLKDITEAIRNDSFNDELQLTNSQVERLEEANIYGDIEFILDRLIVDGRAIKAKEYYNIPDSERDKIKESFKKVFVSHLRRKVLGKQEQNILSTSIPILLWQIEGKSFSEIISLRHAFLSKKDARREIERKFKKEEITFEQALKETESLTAIYSPVASQIPDSTLKSQPGLFQVFRDGKFQDLSVTKIQYDKLVYDTYDYIDKVISLSLRDPISAALLLYFEKTKDSRALILNNYIRYGTNDQKEIWLIRYGFAFDEIDWIKAHVVSIDEGEIIFKDDIRSVDEKKFSVVERFLH